MVQKCQIIDVTKTYIPGDPNAIGMNLISTDKEDGEEKTMPVAPIEGYNFLPTSYGYRSYFGTAPTLDIEALPARIQHLLLIQRVDYTSVFIALCENGIWTIDPTIPGNVWEHAVSISYDPSIYEEWTYCIIENIVYMYIQGHDRVYTFNGSA